MNKLNKLNSFSPFILLSPEVDPLSMDVGDKELTKYPLLPADRLLKFEIKSAEVVAAKAEGRQNLKIVKSLLEESVSTDGDIIHPGFTITTYIPITPSEKLQARTIAGNIAKECQGVGLKGVNGAQVIANPSMLVGKVGAYKTKINPEKDGFPASNSLTPVPAS